MKLNLTARKYSLSYVHVLYKPTTCHTQNQTLLRHRLLKSVRVVHERHIITPVPLLHKIGENAKYL